MRSIHIDPPSGKTTKKISFCSASEGFLVLSNSTDVKYTADSGRNFVSLPITNAIIDFNGFPYTVVGPFSPSGVLPISPDTIFVYGDFTTSPAILYSTNRGQSYKVTYFNEIDTAIVIDMVFPQNDNVGYAISKDRVLKTTDRGQTWSTMLLNYNHGFTFLEAADNNNITAFSTLINGSKLLKSADAGVTWSNVALPPGRLRYCNFLSANRGYISMQNFPDSSYYETVNGGLSWNKRNNSAAFGFASNKIKYLNDSTAFAVALSLRVYKTTDTGRVWEPLPRDNALGATTGIHTDIHFFNNSQFWAASSNAFVELNTNPYAPRCQKPILHLIPRMFLPPMWLNCRTGPKEIINANGTRTMY